MPGRDQGVEFDVIEDGNDSPYGETDDPQDDGSDPDA